MPETFSVDWNTPHGEKVNLFLSYSFFDAFDYYRDALNSEDWPKPGSLSLSAERGETRIRIIYSTAENLSPRRNG